MSDCVPKGVDVGWLEVEVVEAGFDESENRLVYEIGAYRYPLNSCVRALIETLIEDGQGLTDWLQTHTVIADPGWYRIEGIRCSLYEDDELCGSLEGPDGVWYFDKIFKMERSPLPGFKHRLDYFR